MLDLLLHPHITPAIFISTFTLIFLAELPDKTALAIVVLASRHHPFGVFLGCAAAFFIQCVIAVLFGSVFTLLPSSVIHTTSGVLFLVFAVLMWLRKEKKNAVNANIHGLWQAVSRSFLVIFIAEWGDLTQLASATLVAKTAEPWTIFLASIAALWSTSAIAVIIGNRAQKMINAELLQKIAAVLFALVGILLLSGFWGY